MSVCGENEVKKSPATVGMDCVYLVRNISTSDCDAIPIPIAKVKEVLSNAKASKGEFYLEATNPNRKKGQKETDFMVLNRLYVDIDGGMDCSGEKALPYDYDYFQTMDSRILDTFKEKIKEPFSLMTASKFYENGKMKLSYRITYTQLYGTKEELKNYALQVLLPQYQSLLKGVIVLDEKEKLYVKRKDPSTGRQRSYPPEYAYLNIDKSVYDVGRKMRCWNCDKDDKPENVKRPNVLIVGDVLDTLITYIPETAKRVVLPPPVETIKVLSKKRQKTEDDANTVVSYATTTATDFDAIPEEQPVAERNALLDEVLDGLSEMRWDCYDNWVKIGFILYNIGYPLEGFIRHSKKSKHWNDKTSEKWIADKFAGFKKGKMREATLWKWLKEDNYELYIELSKRRMDFWALLSNPNNAEVAHFFYNLKPDAYLYHTELHWYQLQPTGLWLHFDKEPAGLLNDLWETFRPIVREHINSLDLTADVKTEEGERIQKRLKNALKFNKLCGTSRFLKDVLAFLPHNYYREDLPEKMDENRDIIAFSDCLYDFKTNEVRPVKPDDYVCLNTGYAYPKAVDEDATSDVVAFVRGLFESDEYIRENPYVSGAMTSYILRVLADKLCGHRRFQDFYLMTGLGGNGKGLIRNLIARVFGKYFQEVSHQTITKTQEKQNSHSPEMAMAKGKRILMATEPDASDVIQVSIVKAYTGGDQINARPPYGAKPVSYKAQFGLFLQCNMKPKLSKADGGVQRRTRVLKFPYSFKETPDTDNPFHKPADTGVEEETLRNDKWRDAFLHVLLHVYRENKLYEAQSLNPPKDVLEASEEYMDENNPLKSWFKENFRTGLPKDDMRFWISSTELHDQWNKENPKRPINDSAFKNFMEVGCGVTQVKEKHIKKAVRYVDMSDMMCFNTEGDWRESHIRPKKYWVGILPNCAPNPDDLTGKWNETG